MIFFVIGATFIAAGIIRALVIASLWNWFIAPAFHIAELGLVTAFGFSLLASLFTPLPPSSATEGKQWPELLGAMLGATVLGPLVTLAFGWVLHVFFASP